MDFLVKSQVNQEKVVLINFEMNKFVNKLLSAEEKFIPELQLRHPGFTYSACGPFTKYRERKKQFKTSIQQRIR